jgi:hypothetical protein
MKHPLDRILRLRSLLEEISRMELEMRLQEMARLENGLETIERNRRSMRQMRHKSLVQGEASWLDAQVMGEWLAVESFALESMREQKQTAADAAKATYLERRKEHGQIESVIEASASVVAMVRNRREQQELDDWFVQQKQKNRPA